MNLTGRPKSTNPRTKVIMVRVNEDEHTAIQTWADEKKIKVATAVYELLQESSLPERTRIFRASKPEHNPVSNGV